jgi:hypothetical protein
LWRSSQKPEPFQGFGFFYFASTPLAYIAETAACIPIAAWLPRASARQPGRDFLFSC